MCTRGVASLCVAGGVLLLMSIQHYTSHHGSRQAHQKNIEAHQQVEVDSSLQILRGLAFTVRGGRASVKARLVADDCEVPAGATKVHFIRHGEGVHNVAQREWRLRPGYDGRSEPYTVANDPSGKYADALLTPAGEAQARALQERLACASARPCSAPASQPVSQPALHAQNSERSVLWRTRSSPLLKADNPADNSAYQERLAPPPNTGAHPAALAAAACRLAAAPRHADRPVQRPPLAPPHCLRQGCRRLGDLGGAAGSRRAAPN